MPPLKGEVPRRGGGVSQKTIGMKFVPNFASQTPQTRAPHGPAPLSGGPRLRPQVCHFNLVPF